MPSHSIAGALALHPLQAGSVSALVGTLQYGIGIIGSGLIGLFADGTPRPLGCVIAAAGLACSACSRLLPSNPQ